MDFGSGLMSSFGNDQSTYNSGPSDGNWASGSGAGAPNNNHSAVVVGFIVLAALALLVLGVIGLRASGEVVI